jgi:hypothetical protein
MITYNPKDASNVFPAGNYPATMIQCEETQSNSGNGMYALQWMVYNGEAKRTIKDWIVLPSFTWKLKKLAAAFEMMDAFTAEKFNPEDCIGKNALIGLDIREYNGEDQNYVKAYLVPMVPVTVPAEDDPFDFLDK